MLGLDGEFELVFGTSASSPVVGSIITLLNDARLSVGKSTVGFLNPLVSRYLPFFIMISNKLLQDIFSIVPICIP